MNDANAIPPAIPPQIPGVPRHCPSPPLGEAPGEQAPLAGFVEILEAVLRQPRRVMYQLRQQSQGRLVAALLLIALACSLTYGLVVGTFSLGDQLWVAPVKIAGGLFVSALICLPSLYIFSCLSGSRARLVEVFGLLAGLLALLTVLLIGFAPVAWVFSQSTESVTAMGGLHLVFWLISTYFGLRFLHQGFAHFNGTSESGLKVWILIFLLVMVQMTTALRPIVGKSDTFWPAKKMFFLSHWAECLKQ